VYFQAFRWHLCQGVGVALTAVGTLRLYGCLAGCICFLLLETPIPLPPVANDIGAVIAQASITPDGNAARTGLMSVVRAHGCEGLNAWMGGCCGAG
jgi:hypothetical protein